MSKQRCLYFTHDNGQTKRGYNGVFLFNFPRAFNSAFYERCRQHACKGDVGQVAVVRTVVGKDVYGVGIRAHSPLPFRPPPQPTFSSS